MANLRDIKKRISSVTSIGQITRTMEMVAAAKIVRVTNRVVAATPFYQATSEALKALSTCSDAGSHPLLQVHDEEKRIIVIAVASDRGLAGGFNSNILRRVEHYVAEAKENGTEVTFIACGKKVISYFEYRGYEMALQFRDLSSDPTLEQAREISSYVIDEYVSGRADKVFIVYNHTKNAAEQILTLENLLPVQEDLVVASSDDAEEQAEQHAAAFSFEPSPEEVFDRILPGYVVTLVYHALLDSAAAEQGARRTAMKSATDNATEMVSTLTRSYNRARQGAITTEINEIVGGAAALED